ncbi:hypothetical protein M408DRAFT_106605 [Serendipita vermifera MAFF 305830]|uniref:Uncharacterized protein n=1 Tax=Serendipita vermifera MAFF 305830 TaxID=933852 RepID=A0A0C3BC97_SERVB|nr:hypothetical protein M408DRAFT_106605 [Serendipita vermifera MAFF 305830]
MKDATSVNVAIHLEEFKRQLSVEVTNMLQEVGKTARSRERNYLEKEIGEIFNQQVERRQSMAFQPFMHPPPSSAPTRPHSGGPYPAFMAPPGVRSISQSTQPFYPVGHHPTASGIYSRPLPTPSLYEPSPQPAPSTAQTTPLQRRKA